MNARLQKTVRAIERTRARIAELEALLPELERRKVELENAEVIKVFRTADVTAADFAAFVEACRRGKDPKALGPAEGIATPHTEDAPTSRNLQEAGYE